jgi:reactive intermediate/imine deaminase
MKTRIRSGALTEPAPGTYSHALAVDRTIYISGQHAGQPDGTIAAGDDLRAQARAAFANIQALVEAAGATMDDVVKLTIFVIDITQRAAIGDARREFFSGDFPCSTLVQISALAQPGLLVEIEAIAVRSGA